MRLMHWKFSFCIASRVNDSTTPPSSNGVVWNISQPATESLNATLGSTLRSTLWSWCFNLSQWISGSATVRDIWKAILKRSVCLSADQIHQVAHNRFQCLPEWRSFLNILKSLQSSIGQNKTSSNKFWEILITTVLQILTTGRQYDSYQIMAKIFAIVKKYLQSRTNICNGECNGCKPHLTHCSDPILSSRP